MPPEAEESRPQEAKPAEEKEATPLQRLFTLVDISMPARPVDVAQMTTAEAGTVELGATLAGALQIFLKEVSRSATAVEKVDKNIVDFYIAEFDHRLSQQLDAILHQQDFQRLESSWRGLKFLVDRTDFRRNCRIEVLQVAKAELLQNFEDSPETVQSGLYQQIYTQEYDQPGGEPVTAMVSNYEFGRDPQDVTLLQNIAKVAAATHCPFVGSVGEKFFGLDSIHKLPNLPDLAAHFDTAEYTKWRSFRQSEDSRFVGLVAPRFLLRLPYGPESVPTKSFNYMEDVTGETHERYLWGNASYAFAANLARSFVNNGWCVQIRGPQAGGLVENLPIHLYDAGGNKLVKIPTEILIPDTREFEFAKLGFIPLSFYKNRDYACFFSANSIQEPKIYDSKEATANSRISSRLPYIFLVSRIAHYLKVIQRENIGAAKDKSVLEEELNKWIQGLVTEMKNPSPELIATHPLRKAMVKVEDIVENPGFFKVQMFVMPHFQIEGMDVNLSLVAQMPKAK
jgi:type VI secretion system protein ImpC